MKRIVMTLLAAMAISPLAAMTQEFNGTYGGLGNSVLQRVDTGIANFSPLVFCTEVVACHTMLVAG